MKILNKYFDIGLKLQNHTQPVKIQVFSALKISCSQLVLNSQKLKKLQPQPSFVIAKFYFSNIC